MIMEEGLASKSEFRKELERERRRLRDRQRRQSMSHEEREKHLARRRRNYQLRRQRAETARLYHPRSPHIPFEETTASNSIPLFNAVVTVDHDHDQSLDIPAHKLASLPGKVRLNRIKHLARAINDRVSDGTATSSTIKENGNSNCFVSKRLQLNQIKSLARVAQEVNPIMQESATQSHQGIT